MIRRKNNFVLNVNNMFERKWLLCISTLIQINNFTGTIKKENFKVDMQSHMKT